MSKTAPIGRLPLFESAERQRALDQQRLLNPSFVVAPADAFEARFARFHLLNPQVYRALANAAEQALSEGRTRIAVAKLAEDLRDDPELVTCGEPFKLNNDFRAPYADLLIFRDPRLVDLIERRVRRHARNGKQHA